MSVNSEPQLPKIPEGVNLSMFTMSDETEIKFLDCADAFALLTDKEKMYPTKHPTRAFHFFKVHPLHQPGKVNSHSAEIKDV